MISNKISCNRNLTGPRKTVFINLCATTQLGRFDVQIERVSSGELGAKKDKKAALRRHFQS